jgi:hypothetical protein
MLNVYDAAGIFPALSSPDYSSISNSHNPTAENLALLPEPPDTSNTVL